jgi:hypothetical protein
VLWSSKRKVFYAEMIHISSMHLKEERKHGNRKRSEGV